MPQQPIEIIAPLFFLPFKGRIKVGMDLSNYPIPLLSSPLKGEKYIFIPHCDGFPS